ncbi:MAG: collagen-binding domain-containing protein [Sphingomonadaceae bacterium]
MKTGVYVLGAASALLVSTSALAAGDAAAGLQAMRELNVIVFKDMAGTSDIQGKTFVGGNISGTRNYGVGNATQGSAASSRPTLTVGGNINGGTVHNGPNGASGPIAAVPSVVIGGNALNLNVNNNVGDIKVGGSIVGAFPNKDQPGFTIRVGGAVVPGPTALGAADILYNLGAGFSNPLRAGIQAETATLQANLTALSAAMGAFETTLGSGIDYSDPGNVKLKAVAGNAGFAVINTDANTFFNQTQQGLTYDFTPGLPTIVNIFGEAAIWNFETLSGSAYNSSIIFNFVDATAVIINQAVHGSILAPFAALVGPGAPIEGTLAVYDYKQNGPNYIGPPAIPEASTWAMMIAGFGLVGFAARRRRNPVTA